MGDENNFDGEPPPPYLAWQMGAEAQAAIEAAITPHRRYRCAFANWPRTRKGREPCPECSRDVDDPKWHTPIADSDHRCLRPAKMEDDGFWACALDEGHAGKCSAE